MINKGVIIEINKKYIIILDDDGEYIKLKSKKDTYISQEIYYTQNDLYKKKISYTKLSSIAAVFIMCFFVASFFYLNNQDNSYGEEWLVVSVDINPSIEFSLNDQYIVRNVKPLNDEAKKLISEDWIGKDFDQVMTSYIDEVVEKEYLKEEGTVLLAYYSKDQKIEDDSIKEKIEKIINESNANNPSVALIKSSKEDLNKARKEKISLGRYGVYKEISEELGKTVEQVRKGKVKDLIEESDNVKMFKFQNRKNQDDDINNQKNNNNKDNNKENNNGNENGNKKIQDENKNQNGNNGKKDKDNNGKGLGQKNSENIEETNVNNGKNKNGNDNGNKNRNKENKMNSGKGLNPELKPQENSEETQINDEKNKQLEIKPEKPMLDKKEDTIIDEKEETISEDNAQKDNENNQKPINDGENTANKDIEKTNDNSTDKGNGNKNKNKSKNN